MTFDIRQKVFDRDGMPLAQAARQYQDQLLQLFEQSPEGQALGGEGVASHWTSIFLDFALNYLSVTPPKMTPHHVREILFDLFPRKLTASADEAPEVIRELQAFWQFLQREFKLEHAAACLAVLDERAARKLKQEMSDPSNFGIAKSFVTMGLQRGFDMTSEAGMNEWMAIYNAELAAGIGPRIPLPGERSKQAQQFRDMLLLGTGRTRRRSRRRRGK